MNKKIAATLIISAIAVVAFTGIGYSFSAMTYNSGNTAVNEYALLNFGDYSFGSGNIGYSCVSTPADFDFTVESAPEAMDSVLRITVSGCSGLYAGEHFALKVRAFDGGATHSIRADLTVTSSSSDNSLTVARDSVSAAGDIGAASSSTTFAFGLTITGLTSQEKAGYYVSMMRTVYEINRGDSVGTYGGLDYKGSEVGADTITARHAGSDESMLVKLRCPVDGQFADLSGTGWVYAISMALADGQTSSETWDQNPQYAYYDGTGSWTYGANGGLKLTDEKVYDIKLYIAGRTTDGGFGSPFRPVDTIISGGIIQFTYDSTQI